MFDDNLAPFLFSRKISFFSHAALTLELRSRLIPVKNREAFCEKKWYKESNKFFKTAIDRPNHRLPVDGLIDRRCHETSRTPIVRSHIFHLLIENRICFKFMLHDNDDFLSWILIIYITNTNHKIHISTVAVSATYISISEGVILKQLQFHCYRTLYRYQTHGTWKYYDRRV